jgi:hypothetical protein
LYLWLSVPIQHFLHLDPKCAATASKGCSLVLSIYSLLDRAAILSI